MTSLLLLFVILCFAAQEQGNPATSQQEQGMARLKSMLSQIGDQLSNGRLQDASRTATLLGVRISQYEVALVLEELERQLPVDGAGRLHPLIQAAKAACDAEDFSKAELHGKELLTLSDNYPQDPHRGAAIYYGNLVLGRVALTRDRNVEEAKRRLLAAGRTPGSPTLNSFGPNVTLARDLLLIGERDVVLQFFELCRSFWKGPLAQQKLPSWTQTVKTCCQMPDFGANLVY